MEFTEKVGVGWEGKASARGREQVECEAMRSWKPWERRSRGEERAMVIEASLVCIVIASLPLVRE